MLAAVRLGHERADVPPYNSPRPYPNNRSVAGFNESIVAPSSMVMMIVSGAGTGGFSTELTALPPIQISLFTWNGQALAFPGGLLLPFAGGGGSAALLDPPAGAFLRRFPGG